MYFNLINFTCSDRVLIHASDQFAASSASNQRNFSLQWQL